VYALAPAIVYVVSSEEQHGLPLWVGMVAALAVSAVVGLTSGVITTFLRVPSFITTLGMLFLLNGITLHLRGSVREVFFDWLRGYRPDLVPRYERLYARGAYVSAPERRRIEHAAGLPRARLDSNAERFDYRQTRRRPDGTEAPATTEHPASQASLF